MFDLEGYLERQKKWSLETFGGGERTLGVTRHIEKEVEEIRKAPNDLEEWVDVMILAMDGFWRHGGRPEELSAYLLAKQSKNFQREWPKDVPENEPAEHLKMGTRCEPITPSLDSASGTNPGMDDQRLGELDSLLKQRAQAYDDCNTDEVSRLTVLIEEAKDGSLDKA